MKIKRVTLIEYPVLIALLKPTGLDSVSPVIDNLLDFLKLLSFIYILTLVGCSLKKIKKLDLFIFLLILHQTTFFISAIYNNIDVWPVFLNSCSIIFLIVYTSLSIRKLKNYLYRVHNILFILVGLNLLTVMIAPGGFYGPKHYFLGPYTMQILYLLPYIAISVILDNDNEKKRKSIGGELPLRTIVSITIGIITALLTWSGTLVLIVSLITIYYLLINSIKMIKKIRLFNILTYDLINILFFVFIVIKRDIDKFSYIITDLLGKDLTFTGRTEIWDIAIQLIKQNFLIGYGTSEVIMIAGHAHNYYLDSLLRGGIFASFTLVSLIVIISISLWKYRKYYNAKWIAFILGIIFLTFEVEAYPTNLQLYFLMFYLGYRINTIIKY